MASNKSQERQPNQKKVTRPGKKSLRGVAENDYGELKKTRCLSLTPTCYANLQNLARQSECSVSEILERFSRLASKFQLFLEASAKRESQPPEGSSPYIEAESPDLPNLELPNPPE